MNNGPDEEGELRCMGRTQRGERCRLEGRHRTHDWLGCGFHRTPEPVVESIPAALGQECLTFLIELRREVRLPVPWGHKVDCMMLALQRELRPGDEEETCQ